VSFQPSRGFLPQEPRLGTRARTGEQLFTYHKDPDGNTIELFTQLDLMHDENKGYWEPRPWQESYPLYPKTWEVDLATVNIWGPINQKMMD
jgi:hypothetical protein